MINVIESYFTSVWSWFIENKDAITAFFMSGQAVSFVAALVMLIKNMSQVKTNTQSTTELNKTIEGTKVANELTKKTNDNVIKLNDEVKTLVTNLNNTAERLNAENKDLVNKMNSIIDVQSIVYSTIRDDQVRQTVNNILNNARYSDINTKEKLQAEIEELKKIFDDKIAGVTKTVDDAIVKVSDNLNVVEDAKKVMEETHVDSLRTESDVTRY